MTVDLQVDLEVPRRCLDHARIVGRQGASVIPEIPELSPELLSRFGGREDTGDAVTGTLFERDRELAVVEAWLRSGGPPAGRMLLVQGPAGIGKTALIDHARRRAVTAGWRVLAGHGSEMEQGFAFGVVRQLLEPLLRTAGDAQRERWLAGAAAPAAEVIDLGVPVAGAPEAGYRLLHALYWLLVNLTDEGPLAVVVDDAHWADEPSLRLLAFLGSRLESLRLVAVLGARFGRLELAALERGSSAVMIRPRQLSETAVAGWLSVALGRAPQDGFTRECRRATGGNPFLLRELIGEIEREGIAPDAAHAVRLGAISPPAVATSVLVRLAGLGDPATALARSVAVLEQTSLEVAAELAGLELPVAGQAAAALAGAEVLTPEPALSFAHPILRTAVYQDSPAGERATMHARAAGLLADRGAPVDRVAAHLMLAPPGDASAVKPLCAAAAQARALGVPEVAASYLERALLEVRAGPEHVQLLLDAGRANLDADRPAAIQQLRQALAGARDNDQLVAAAITLARGLSYRGSGLEAVEVLVGVGERIENSDPRLRALVDLELLACRALSAAARHRLAAWTSARLIEPSHPARGAWDHLVLANLALDAALGGEPVDRVSALADRAVAGYELLGNGAVSRQVGTLAAAAYLLADRFDRARTLFDAMINETEQLGLAGFLIGMLANRANLQLRRGRLGEAAADADRALALGQDVEGPRSFVPRAAAVQISIAAERGTTPHGALTTISVDPDSVYMWMLEHSRAELLLAQGKVQAGVAALLAYGQRNRALGWGGPCTPWRSQAGLALAGRGDREQAHALIEEELEMARRQASLRSIGVALRAAGLLAHNGSRLRHLHDAVDALADSGAELEHARALVDLGAEHRRHGKTSSARHLLRHGHQLATRCHATRLIARAETELRAAGARPRPTAATGPESLSPSERRVAELVADGLSNRQAAQTLFLSEKTVETHLAAAYTKLGIRSRKDLATALNDPAAPQRADRRDRAEK